MPDLSQLIYAIADSPWAYAALAAVLLVDGFFPFVPGETAVVTLATLGATGHGPQVWLVLVESIVATMVGDGIAFAIGRRMGIGRWGWMRRPRIAAAFDWARRGLHRRPALVLIAAKFVPFLRVAVTMTAGAGRLPVRRYLPASLVASVLYTGYHVGIALIAGSVFAAYPLLGTVAAIVVVLVLGFAFERVGRVVVRRRATVAPAPRNDATTTPPG